ncbi:hypothetical protein [Limosilactobacillus mucosae]|uniref:hypothetical protein n=1 Tax=Limosilactobacillus mucosae TaxID=97478 RepID=UPI0022E3D0F9|nr:hypothetical protein [Limosilactobacillus mucosae]
MIKQSKHWLTGLLMAAMVLSLTGCASVSSPTGNNQSADSSSSAKAVSHQRAQKKHAAAKTSKVSQTSQSISSSATAATSSSLDSAAVQSSDAAVQKAEPATSAAQTTVSQAAASNESAQAAATVNDQVVDGLNQAAGLQPENGDQYMTSPISDGSWQVDIRTSSGAGQDPNVSHLKGIYKYNPATGQYQQMDPMTGEFN